MHSYNPSQIVSVFELKSNMAAIMNKVSEEGYLAVFNANKPDLIIADIAYFEKLLLTKDKCEQLEKCLAVMESKARNKLVPLNLCDFD